MTILLLLLINSSLRHWQQFLASAKPDTLNSLFPRTPPFFNVLDSSSSPSSWVRLTLLFYLFSLFSCIWILQIFFYYKLLIWVEHCFFAVPQGFCPKGEQPLGLFLLLLPFPVALYWELTHILLHSCLLTLPVCFVMSVSWHQLKLKTEKPPVTESLECWNYWYKSSYMHMNSVYTRETTILTL